MSLPPLINADEATLGLWQRKARDLLNAVALRTMGKGLTASRPPNPDIGTIYFDTTLNRPIWFGSAGWIDASGASV